VPSAVLSAVKDVRVPSARCGYLGVPQACDPVYLLDSPHRRGAAEGAATLPEDRPGDAGWRNYRKHPIHARAGSAVAHFNCTCSRLRAMATRGSFSIARRSGPGPPALGKGAIVVPRPIPSALRRLTCGLMMDGPPDQFTGQTVPGSAGFRYRHCAFGLWGRSTGTYADNRTAS
jgi:hypothetical protein